MILVAPLGLTETPTRHSRSVPLLLVHICRIGPNMRMMQSRVDSESTGREELSGKHLLLLSRPPTAPHPPEGDGVVPHPYVLSHIENSKNEKKHQHGREAGDV